MDDAREFTYHNEPTKNADRSHSRRGWSEPAGEFKAIEHAVAIRWNAGAPIVREHDRPRAVTKQPTTSPVGEKLIAVESD